MSDINSDLIAQEVDDEVRRERMNALWKAYGKYVIGAAVGVVLVVAGREIYNWQVKKTESAQSEAFASALEDAQVEGADVSAIWQAAMPNLGDGYGALAQLRLAGALVADGKNEDALAVYEALSKNTKADEALRDLATLKAGMLMVGRPDSLDAAKSKLATIAVKGKAWYFTAQEQLALIDLKQGDTDAALLKFTLLADDAQTPQTIQARARQFRDFIETQNFAAESASSVSETEEEAAPAASEGDSQ